MKRECKWCGDSFEAKRSDHDFCSAHCRQKYANTFRREKSADADFWAVTEPYGSHGFDPLVALWMRSSAISGSTLIGANHG